MNFGMDLSINERIAAFRRLSGLSQKQMANVLGIKPSTYSRMETKGSFKPEVLVKIAQILNVPIEEILYADPPKPVTEEFTPTKAAQPKPNFFEDTRYIFTKEDTRIIKAINSLPKERKDLVLKFIEEQLKR